MSSDDERWLMMAVMDHLQQASEREGAKTESLQEAIFAISNAYTLNMHSTATKQRYPLNGLSLPEVFKVGRDALLKAHPNGSDPPSSQAEGKCSTGKDSGFDRFLQRLRESTAFFKGVEEGSPEFDQRISQARKKYDERVASKKQRIEKSDDTSAPKYTDAEDAAAATSVPRSTTESLSSPHTADAASTSTAANAATTSTAANAASTSTAANAASSVEAKERAVKLKERGNAQLKAKQYEASHRSYSECIELDPDNAVYYSNRAAANILLSRFNEAVDDCKKAIALNPSFVRPRERLASAYRYLGMARNEVEALRGAVSIQPGNDVLQALLQDAEARFNRDIDSRAAGGNSGMDANMINMMARSVGMNVPEGIAESLANSDIINQVGSMVRDNPAMVEQMMRMMGGMNGGAMGGGRGSG